MSRMPGRIVYFAFGANVHPGWLRRRVPRAQLLGIGVLPGHRLAFRKRGRDGAARSDACPDAAARLPGVLYALDAPDLALLGAAGAGYRPAEVVIDTAQGACEAICWRAEPSAIEEGLLPWDWYVALIRAGASLLGLPGEHVRWLDSVPVAADPDPERAALARAVIAAGMPGSPAGQE